MTLVSRDSLLTTVCTEIKKSAPFVFAKCTEELESTDKTDITSSEESTFVLIINQRADIIRAKCESPRGAVSRRVLDEKKGVVVKTEMARLVSNLLYIGEPVVPCQMPKDNAVKLVSFGNHLYKMGVVWKRLRMKHNSQTLIP